MTLEETIAALDGFTPTGEEHVDVARLDEIVDRLSGAEQIEAACKADKKEEAAKLGAELYGNNEMFKNAVDSAAQVWNVADVRGSIRTS